MDAPNPLLSLHEVARLLDLSNQRVHQLRRRDDFPRPRITWSGIPLWDRSDIEGWAASHPCGARRWGTRFRP
ncbi:MAG: DNA-binding protein [Candidatus Velamenicoccus archaeovorus]